MTTDRETGRSERRFFSALSVAWLLFAALAGGAVGWSLIAYPPAPAAIQTAQIDIALPPPVAAPEPVQPPIAAESAVENKTSRESLPTATPPVSPPSSSAELRPAPDAASSRPAAQPEPKPEITAAPPPPPGKTQPPEARPPEARPPEAHPPVPQSAPSVRAPDAKAEIARVTPPNFDGRAARAVRRDVALPKAPDPALIEDGPSGPLPRIGPDGREPWIAYARPFDKTDKRPRISIVVSGLGLSAAATKAAIQQLPGGITLAFAPYAENLQRWIGLARAAGHEVLLNLPMEPVNYPLHDPGPRALLTSLKAAENLDRLDWLLSRSTGYVGVTNFMGSRFTASEKDLRPVLDVLKRRGLMILDSRSSAKSAIALISGEIGLPQATNNRFIDNTASRLAIDARLAQVEQIARQNGVAIAMGFSYPVTIERLAAWVARLEERGFTLAPISAVASRKSS